FVVERLYRSATARAVDHPDERQSQLVCHLLRHDLFAADGGVRGTAANGEVVDADHDGTLLDTATAEDEVCRTEVDEVAGRVVASGARDLADLVERTLVEQQRDALTCVELAAVALPLDLLFAAHQLRQRFASFQLI